MKFHFFHLMPWPYLPEDFRQKYRSVWVDVPSALFDPEKGHRLYHEYLDELEAAEAAGFDGLCVNEHHQNAYGLMPSPNLIAATLARNTRRAKIVLMGNSVALYNPPTRVAEETAMLDVLSGGRLVAGFPVGTPMDTTFAYGENPATLRDKYREGVELVLRAWQEPDVFSFNGKYTQLRYVNLWPRPIQRPHPPVWVPGGASVETWDWCLEKDFLYANLSYFGYREAKTVMDGFWAAAERRNLDRNPYRAGFLQFVAVADNDAEAERLYAEHAHYFYNRCLHVYPGFADAPGYRTIKTLQIGAVNQYSRTDHTTLSWKDLVDGGYVVAGSPETVRQQMEHLIKSLRVGNIFLLLHAGNMPKDKCMYSTRLFAEKVMPHLRNIWPDYAQDERFWCHPLAQRVAPAPLAASGQPARQMEPAK